MALHQTLRGLAAITLAVAAAGASPEAKAVGQLADVVIVDRTTGATLPTYPYRGEYWVAGTPGGAYALEVRNRLGQRVLAVPSVDGVNVLTGETAGWDQAGYVLSPYQRYQIPGWRKSESEVAAFTFTDASRSYAERTGRPAHVGVIGVALFREAQPVAQASAPWPSPAPYRERGSTDAAREAAPAARAPDASDASGALRSESRAAAAPKLGTGHGAREASVVSDTQFTRLQPQPQELIRIRYDSRENLVAMGIIRDRPVPGPRPDAFPGSSGVGYVPDPPSWR